MEPRPLPHYIEGEYGALNMPDAWHVASLACFAASLGARFLVKILPFGVPFFGRAFLSALAVLVLSGLGLLFGLLGLRNPEGRGIARIGVFLNATVLVLGTLGMAWFYRILSR
jgi:hypothetical protein